MNGAAKMTPENLAAAAFRLRELGILIALGVAVLFFTVRATNFLTRRQLAGHRQGRGNRRRRRNRRDDGHPDAQHRSQRRVDGRSLRVLSRRHACGSQRRAAGPRSCAGDGRRNAARTGQRSAGHRRPRAGDHRDAGDIGHLPRTRVRGHQRRGDLGVPAARQLPEHRARSRSACRCLRGSRSVSHLSVRPSCAGRRGPATSMPSGRTRTRHG